jgi:hypothetical protein
VGVDINEPGRDKLATNVKGLLSLKRARRGNRSNPTSPDSEVAQEPGIPAPIQNSAISNHDVESRHWTTFTRADKDSPRSSAASP